MRRGKQDRSQCPGNDGSQSYFNGSYDLLPDGQISALPRHLHVQPCLQKYFCFSEAQISSISSPSRSLGGALRNVTNAGRDAVDAAASPDE